VERPDRFGVVEGVRALGAVDSGAGFEQAQKSAAAAIGRTLIRRVIGMLLI
jgi:hypothetical protein